MPLSQAAKYACVTEHYTLEKFYRRQLQRYERAGLLPPTVR